MQTTTLNPFTRVQRIWRGLLAVALLCTAFSASAQIFPRVFEGTLSFPGKMVNECDALNRGDSVNLRIAIFLGDGVPRPSAKWPLREGEFAATTTSGVPVTGYGTFIGSYRSGTLYIHRLTVGDSCHWEEPNLKVRMQ
jgi:hypothetical protein